MLWKLKLHTPTHPAGGNLKLSMNFILKQIGRLSTTLDAKGRAAKSADDDLRVGCYRAKIQLQLFCLFCLFDSLREKLLQAKSVSVR